MAGQAQTVVRFGVFQANLRSGELYKHGLRIRVPRQPFKILVVLLERPGEVVTREELRKRLWPDDTFVDFEHSVNSAIKKLRVALGDSAENPRYIETLPRLGYRFVAPVYAAEEAAITEGEGFGALARAAGASAPDALPALLTPLMAGDELARRPVAADRESYVANSVAGKPGLRIRRVVGLGALLAIVAATWLMVNLRRNRGVPFETVTTARLTNSGQSIKAAIAPDGRYIAHTLIISGLETLQVRRATTLHDIEIVAPAPVHYLGITFSPDSESIYYATHTAADEPSVLFRVPVMGGSAQKLKQDLASPVTFSPDGTKYAFVRESKGESSLILTDLDSGAEHRLIARKLPEVLDYPAWSPDGRIIACTDVDTSIGTAQGSNARIVEVRVTNGTEKAISGQTWGFIRQLAWLGNGHGLVMSARGKDTGVFHVWYVSYPGGIGRKVTEGLNNQVGVSASADSREIVTVEESTLSGIWRLRRSPHADLAPIVSGLSGSSIARCLPDGRVLFEKELNGRRNIWTVDEKGKNEKQLTLAGNNYYPSVSGDGRTFTCISDRNGSSAVWTMDIDGGNAVMAAKTFGDAVPQLSPDGKWIAFTARGSGHWTTLWRVRSRGGQAAEINDNLWFEPTISPDGKWIAGFYADRRLSTSKEPTSIAVIPIDGGKPWKVFSIPTSVSITAGIRWSRDGRQLTYVDGREDGDNIWSQSLNGGPPREMTQFHGEALFSFDWSQDGKELVISRGIQARDVVLIQDARRQ